MTRRIFVWTVGLLAVAGGWIVAQDQKDLTARELFYGASSSKKAVPGSSPDSSSRNPKAGVSSQIPEVSKSGSTPNTSPSAGNTIPKQGAGHTVEVQPDSEPQSPAIVNAVYTPLGLRYSVLKGTGPGQFVETDVNTTFRSGDGIRVSIESNDDAYLYIVNKGSSGTWSLLFPSPDINNGNNRVQARHSIEVPAAGQFTFVDEPGEERLFVVLSRPPEAGLEQLISSLIRPDRPKDFTVNSITDELVGRLRSGVIARDLIFEKVQDETPAGKEKATYIVNVNGSGSSRVVADLSLRHQ